MIEVTNITFRTTSLFLISVTLRPFITQTVHSLILCITLRVIDNKIIDLIIHNIYTFCP